MTLCTLPTCPQPTRAKGWCGKHYTRWHRHGDPEALAAKYKPYVTADGYRVIRMKSNDPYFDMGFDSTRTANSVEVAEHRYVMAHYLGRPLREDESVHHINGDKLDNRVENLQLRTRHHGAGIVMQCADCGSSNLVEAAL